MSFNPPRLAFFGGSFDPPHRGHLAIARAATRQLALDQVLFAPTGRQPFKARGAHAPFADRLRMVELLCEGEPGWQASNLDAPHPDNAPNYTVDALEMLAHTHPDASLFAILGADSLEQFPRWHRASRLLELATWVVVSRPGYTPGPLPPGARVHLISDVAVPLASHTLRERLAAGDPCTADIPGPILHYIHQRGLYAPTASLLPEPSSR